MVYHYKGHMIIFEHGFFVLRDAGGNTFAGESLAELCEFIDGL